MPRTQAAKDRLDPNKRDYYNTRLSALRTERESFIGHYKELSQFISPRKGRFTITDRNKGDKRYNNIINSRATWAHKIARAGMFAGTMSPARPWFKLGTPDPDLEEFQSVKFWLEAVQRLLLRIFEDSNLYQKAPTMIGEVLQFATGAMFHDNDFNDVARFYSFTAGSYYVDQNDREEIDTLVREFEWTALQIVSRFGYDNCSQTVKTAYDNGNYSQWYPVVHFIEPNNQAKRNARLARDMRFRSVYYEPSHIDETKNLFLRRSGYKRFPAYCPRWDTTGSDIYGTDCPAMSALGDIKQLQSEEKTKGQGLQKMVNPSLTGPASLQGKPVNSLPGGLTVYDGDDTRQKLRSVYDVRLNFQDLRLDIAEVEKRIEENFFVDMFLAISNIEGIQPRNELDLIQRNEERLLMLGPVLQQLHREFLADLIENTFQQCIDADILPPAPRELQNTDLKVTFISTLAMAQQAVATQSIERVIAFAGNLAAQGWTQALDKVDPDQAVDEYSTAIGAPVRLIVSDDVVQQRRRAAEERQAQQAALAQAQQGADVAKTLGDTNTRGANALAEIADNV